MDQRRKHFLLLLVILAVSLAIRIVFATRNGLWFDEAIVLHRAAQGLGRMLQMVRDGDNCPPLHYLVMWAYVHMFGTRPQWVVELPSILVSLVGIGYAYLLGREASSARTGLAAAALLGVSSYYLKYSWEIRVYAFLATFCLASSYHMLRLTRDPARWRHWIGYVLATACALGTHYFAFLVLLVQNLFVLAFHRRRHFLTRWFLANGAAGILFLPWSPLFLTQVRRVSGEFWIPPLSLPWFTSQLFALTSINMERYLSGALQPEAGTLDWLRVSLAGWVTIGATIILIVLACLRMRESRLRPAAFYWLLYFLVPVAFIALFSMVRRPLFLQRYFSASMPGLAMMAAVGLGDIRSRWSQAILVLLLVLGAADVVEMLRHPHEQGPRRVAQFVSDECRRGDTIIFLSPYYYFPVAYYDRGRHDLRMFMTEGGWRATTDQVDPARIVTVEGARSATREATRVFFVDGYYYDPDYERLVDENWRRWFGLSPDSVRLVRRAGPQGEIYVACRSQGETDSTARTDLNADGGNH